MEVGETLNEALERELQEEVSIEIEIGGLVTVLDRIVHDQEKRVRFHYVIADYWGWMVSGEPRPASDISDARFVSLGQVQNSGVHPVVVETILMGSDMRRKAQGLGPKVSR